MVTNTIDCGAIILVDLDPTAGHEQGRKRPVIVLSNADYFKINGMAHVLPITSKIKGYPFEVPLPATNKTQGVILADQGRILDLKARQFKFLETTTEEILEEARAKCAAVLGITP